MHHIKTIIKQNALALNVKVIFLKKKVMFTPWAPERRGVGEGRVAVFPQNFQIQSTKFSFFCG